MKKDGWDKFSAVSIFLSSVLIAGVGTYFTHQFDQRQAQANELEVLEKFIPHLISENAMEQKLAIIDISTLANAQVATQIATLYQTEGTVEGVKAIAINGSPDDRVMAQNALKQMNASLNSRNLSNDWIQRATNYVAYSEGFLTRVYIDGAGNKAIGYEYVLTGREKEAAALLKAVGVSDPAKVIDGGASINQDQAKAILESSFIKDADAARDSLGVATFDSLSPARKFVLVDFIYNVGIVAFNRDLASPLKMAAATPANQAYYFSQAALIVQREQTRLRGTRNAKMMRTGEWVDDR